MSDYLKNLRVADPVLTTIAQGYAPNQFVAETIMPVVSVEKEAVKVPVHGSHAAFFEYDTERAVGADSNVITIDSNAWLTVNTGISTFRPSASIASRSTPPETNAAAQAAYARLTSCAIRAMIIISLTLIIGCGVMVNRPQSLRDDARCRREDYRSAATASA